jgi:hypothetical protein
MVVHDMAETLRHPHPNVPFSAIGDDIITALATLKDIFKNEFQKPVAPQFENYPPHQVS